MTQEVVAEPDHRSTDRRPKTGQAGGRTEIRSAVFGHGNDVTFPAGESTYHVYLITESLQNVTARMDDLFRMGVR